MLRVTDTGVGISPESLPFIFDAFRQADPSLTRVARWIGPGLAIVRDVVELHGGTVDGRKWQGSARCDIHGDVALGVKDRLGSAARSPSHEELSPALAGLRVLAVDDDERLARSSDGGFRDGRGELRCGRFCSRWPDRMCATSSGLAARRSRHARRGWIRVRRSRPRTGCPCTGHRHHRDAPTTSIGPAPSPLASTPTSPSRLPSTSSCALFHTSSGVR